MASFERFEDLEVWQLSRAMVKKIYEVSKETSISKDFRLLSQLQSSAVSIMSNIAEGFERKSNKEFIQYLHISKGSCAELRSLLYVLNDISDIDKENINSLINETETISKSLAGFIKYLKNN